MSTLELLDQDEEILFIVHKHWFALMGEIVLFTLAGLAPLVVVLLIGVVPADLLAIVPGNATLLAIALAFLWLTFVLPFVFVVWTDHYLDSLILTTKRVIDIEQKGLFSREVSSFRLDRVQDITTEVNGLIPTMLNFGNVHIQTAGETRQFIARFIPAPDEVKTRILREQNRERNT